MIRSARPLRDVSWIGFSSPGIFSPMFDVTDDMVLVDMRDLNSSRAAERMSSIKNLCH